jgi:lysozyme
MTKPRASESLVKRKLVEAIGEIPSPWKMYIVGVRGYYHRSMGDPTKNDRNIYDDAAFVFGPSGFKSFNFNTDPSAYRQGIASLVPNFVYWYRKGMHGISRGNPYPAFRPSSPGERSKVTRDKTKNPWDGTAINIHRGGNSTTSSLGCQTVPPAQWNEFYTYVTNEMKLSGMSRFPYVIIDGPIT